MEVKYVAPFVVKAFVDDEDLMIELSCGGWEATLTRQQAISLTDALLKATQVIAS